MRIKASNILTLLLAVLLTAGCGVPKDRFRLNGKFKHLRSADICIYADDRYDTIHIRDGSFTYERTLTEPTILTIQYPNFAEMKVIGEPGKEAKFVTDASDLTQTKVTGTDENEILTDFYLSTINEPDAKIQKTAEKVIRKNPKTIAAEALLRTYFVEEKNINVPLTKQLLRLLQKNQPDNASLSRLSGSITQMLNTAVGSTVPAFSAKPIRGQSITDKTFRGKYLLLFFWASWEYDSYQQVLGLKNIVRPYGSRLGVVNVCLDNDYKGFSNTIHRDSLAGYNVCDKQAWSSPLVHIFGVQYVPGNILVDPKGKIIARDLDNAALTSRLATLLKK